MATKVVWNKQLASAVKTAGNAALLKAGGRVLEVSNQQAPLQDGKLIGSGKVTQEDGQVVISYNTDYAVKQHEDVRLRHPNGRKAKFLQSALQSSVPEVLATLAAGVEGVLK